MTTFVLPRLVPSRAVLLFIGVYLLALLPWVIPNGGGTDGVNLPWVMTGWLCAGLLMATVWAALGRSGRPLRLTPSLWGFVAGSVLLTVPFLLSPSRDWQLNAWPAVAGLWGGVLLYVTLLQARLTRRQGQVLALCLALAAGLQALYALLQLLFSPVDWLPAWSNEVTACHAISVGVFQQRNLTASFIATGLAVSLWLRADIRAHWARHEGLRRALLAAILLLCSAALMMLKSRIGVLSGSLVMVMALWRWCRQGVAALWLWPLLGTMSGLLLSAWLPPGDTLTHDMSDTQRLFTLHWSLVMLAQHPWRGWGAGGFEYAFQHFLAAHTPPVVTGHGVMSHPHNEILFQAVEGGALALAGLALWLVTALRLLWRRGRDGGTALLVMLPVLLHTQTEFPVYQSVVHWFILVVVLALCDGRPERRSRRRVWRAPLAARRVTAITLCAGGLTMALLSGVALHNQQVLTAFERHPSAGDTRFMHLPLPWLAPYRLMSDRAEWLLLQAQNGRLDALPAYLALTERYLQVHTDADMYDNRIRVARFLGLTALATHDHRLAALLFPFDPRFNAVLPPGTPAMPGRLHQEHTQ